jgi:DNA-binding Lrp family transcriptional regulator
MSLAPTAANHPEVSWSQAPRELLGHTRPGRRFEPTEERLLDDHMVTLATRLPRAVEGLALVREFPGGRGVADAVAVTGWQEPVRQRVALQLPFLDNETDCSVVAALSPNQTRTVTAIGKRLGMSDEQVVRRLRPLAAVGYVESRGSGFRRVRGLEPIGRAYALEAKVSDWQQGVGQALRYSTWCDAAAVVLLRPPRELSDAKERCSKLGLGLAAGGRWVVRPRIGRPHAGLRLAMSEQFARLIVESESF